jgi:hypothetical protein
MPLAKRGHKIRQHVDSRGGKMREGEKKRKKAGRRKQQQTDALDAI